MSMSRWARFALFVVLAVTAAAIVRAGVGPQAAFAAQEPVIRAIEVTGTSRTEPETVKSHLTFKEGQRYEARNADDSVKALYATGLYSDVRIKLEGGIVKIAVDENPLVNRVVFEGNKEVKSEDLAKEVQIKARQPLVRARIQAEVQRVLDLYRRQGYYAAQVDPKTHRTGPQARGPRLRNPRRPRDQGCRHQFHRQPLLHRRRAARGDLHHRDRPARFPRNPARSTIRTASTWTGNCCTASI